jgi:outer membrane protein OmpA-like peptidoglycan-associated protein
MKKLSSLLIVLAVLITACQTAAKPVASTTTAATKATPANQTIGDTSSTVSKAGQPPQADVSSIKAGDTGFSPLAQAPHNFMTFTLHFGRPDAITAWTIDFVDLNDTVVHHLKGAPPQLPSAITWDGTSDDGTPAAEGAYVVRLSVDHGAGVLESLQTDSILLDRTPASGTIAVTPALYTPRGTDKVTLALKVTPGIASVVSWRLFVVHPNGSQFMNFISEDHKDNTVVWDGLAQSGNSLEPGTTYNLTAQIFDQYGNVGTLKSTLRVGMAGKTQVTPVTVTLNGKLIAETKIYFPAFSSNLNLVDQATKNLNNQGLDALAAALKAAPGARIKVIGHANKVFWEDQAKGDIEQQEVLIPLSKARALAVSDALVTRGLDAGLFDLDGVGAIGAVAPFGDLVNNWKNRQVEFKAEN